MSTGKCPHGYAHPPSAVFRGGTEAMKADARTRVIHDSRECPDCLRLQITEAHHILNRVFGREGLNLATYELWTHYLTRYNP